MYLPIGAVALDHLIAPLFIPAVTIQQPIVRTVFFFSIAPGIAILLVLAVIALLVWGIYLFVRGRAQSSRSPATRLDSETAAALSRACAFAARYWADVLRNQAIGQQIQRSHSVLGDEFPVISPEKIDAFEAFLSTLVFNELSQLEEESNLPQPGRYDFRRWVGCNEYVPITYLAKAAHSFNISLLYFPGKNGWYVYPGRVVNSFAEEIEV